jgi:hypothetical protein
MMGIGVRLTRCKLPAVDAPLCHPLSQAYYAAELQGFLEVGWDVQGRCTAQEEVCVATCAFSAEIQFCPSTSGCT